MLHIHADECSSIPVLLALFKNECTRVIADRYGPYKLKVRSQNEKTDQMTNKKCFFF